MNHPYPSPSATNLVSSSTAIPAQNGITRILVIGCQDTSIDHMVRLTKASGSNYLVACIKANRNCLEKLAAAEPDILMIQDKVLRESREHCLQDIQSNYPDVHILVFGNDMDDDYLYNIVKAGARGYVNERMKGEHIKHALRAVARGESWVERHILERFVNDRDNADAYSEFHFQENIRQLGSKLTQREAEILCEVLKGLAIKEIAEAVHLSHQGVKMHLARLFRKFEVTNRNQLILAAFDNISPDEGLSSLLRSGLRHQQGACE